jgi:hypothetical protein
MLKILSLGAGVQSTKLALSAAEGEICPMPDCAIFADTAHEPREVYDHLQWLMSPGVLPYPVYIVSAGDLFKSASTVKRTSDGQRTYISTAIPVYMQDGLRRGIGQRHCTRDFKIAPINRKIRELAGLRRVLKKHGVIAEVWIGISTDEAQRMKPATMPWLVNRWPLIERGESREDCIRWLRRRGVNAPRSACTFCPFRDEESWLRLSAEEFSGAVAKERELQSAYQRATEMRGVPYFHASRVPLDRVDFSSRADKQPDLFGNECEGMCGI